MLRGNLSKWITPDHESKYEGRKAPVKSTPFCRDVMNVPINVVVFGCLMAAFGRRQKKKTEETTFQSAANPLDSAIVEYGTQGAAGDCSNE